DEAQENLGDAYLALGTDASEQKAVDVLEDVYAWRSAHFNRDDPRTLAAQAKLGAAFRRTKRLSDAERVTTDALDRRRRTLGPDHPDTLDSQQRLAWLRYAQERYGEAEQLLKEVVEASGRPTMRDQSRFLLARQELAHFYHLREQWE